MLRAVVFAQPRIAPMTPQQFDAEVTTFVWCVATLNTWSSSIWLVTTSRPSPAMPKLPVFPDLFSVQQQATSMQTMLSACKSVVPPM
jgi:hypothetical protein